MIIKEPKFAAMDYKTIQKVMKRSNAERLQFFDIFCRDAANIMNLEYQPEYPDSYIGYVAEEAGESMRNRYSGLLRQINGNPSGKKPGAGNDSDEPLGGPKEPLGGPKGGEREPNINHNHQSESINHNLESSIINALLADGYRLEEIQMIAARAEGRDIKDWFKYLKAGIDQERKKNHLPEHDYEQRDYNEQPETMEQQIERLQAEIGGGDE